MSPSSNNTIKNSQKDTFFGVTFENSYSRLPENFYQRLSPTSVKSPSLVALNYQLATELGFDIDALSSNDGIALLAGNKILAGSDPIAIAYAGHQFGYFVPQLGDGRAHLLAEIIDGNGQRRDMQLKGSGQTAYSRDGDGRAPLGSVIREYILSEAMHALGISTTRSLAAVTTGEQVYRQSALPGGILTRVAASHIRIGTFEYFAAQNDYNSLKCLADYAISRHYHAAKATDNPYRSLLESVLDGQAKLIASWMNIGFIHGVMNTDNTSIAGETIDYGPCAFMDSYDYKTVFSSIDQYGRYAYGNQALVMQWNLTRFGESLLPLLDPDTDKAVQIVEEVIDTYQDLFSDYWLAGLCQKLGLTEKSAADLLLGQNLFELMQKHAADFTLTFRYLCDVTAENADAMLIRSLFDLSNDFDQWLSRWRNRLLEQTETQQQCIAIMRNNNPAFIPRNHRVEQAIESAVESGDFSKMYQLIKILSDPYHEQPEFADYASPPQPGEWVGQTFCGT